MLHRGAPMVLKAGMMTLQTGDSSGWTLIELIVAMTILVVGLAGIMVTMGRVLEGANQVALSAEAALLAEKSLGEMELQGWTQGTTQETSGDSGRFHWQTRIVTDKDKPIELWTSTVTWPVRGKEQTYEISRTWYRMRTQSP